MAQNDLRIADPVPRQNYVDRNVPMGHQRNMTQVETYPYGMPNRPSTPIRTVVNGVYGVVADFEITNRQADIVSAKIAEKVTKPSKAHTRASTMA